MNLSKPNLSLYQATSRPVKTTNTTKLDPAISPLQSLYLDTENNRVVASNSRFLVMSYTTPAPASAPAVPPELPMFLHTSEAQALYRSAANATLKNKDPETTTVTYAQTNPRPATKDEPLTIKQGKRTTIVNQPAALQYPDVAAIACATATDTPLYACMSLQSLEDLITLTKAHGAKYVNMRITEPRQHVKFQTPRNADQQFTAYIMPCVV